MLSELSADRMMRDAAEIAKYIRLAGSADEAAAFDYIEGELRALDLDVQRLTSDALVSLPGPATLVTTSPEPHTFTCITHSMAASTPDGGLAGELRYVGAGSRTDFADEDIAVALVDGLVSPGVVATAAAHGCRAVIFCGDEHLHQGIISSLYGSPTTRTMSQLPDSVAVSITGPDGDILKQQLAAGAVNVRITATLDTGWRNLPLLVADLPSPTSDNTFAFFGVHVDSWDYGGTDNGAGNAILLELARVFTAHRRELQRGVRFLFWSGHSHGRYAGSCWYVDNFWQDLYDRAIIGMSIDSPGTKGANVLGGAKVMDEAVAVATQVAELVVGRSVPAPKRPPGGEQPLWRVGIPSMNPVRWRHSKDSGYSLRFQPTSPWWHHTVDDTVDKIDPTVLLSDAQIYGAGLWRFVAEELLPYDYGDLARAVAAHLRTLPSVLDIGALVAAAEALERAVESMNVDAADQNRRMRLIGRALIPTLYTIGGQFEPDTTSSKGFIPGLGGAMRLAELDPDDPVAHALRTELTRESNRLLFALRTATDIANGH